MTPHDLPTLPVNDVPTRPSNELPDRSRMMLPVARRYPAYPIDDNVDPPSTGEEGSK